MKATLALLLTGCLLGLLLLSGCGTAAPEPEPKPAEPMDPVTPAPPETARPLPAHTSKTRKPETFPADEGPGETPAADTEPAEGSGPDAETAVPPESLPAGGWPEAKLAQMTLEEKVAQMFIVTPEALTGISGTATVAGQTTQNAFERIPVGGILYMARNLENPTQTKALLAGMREISRERIGLVPFLCVDEEGGPVARIGNNPAFGVPKLPPMAEIGKTGDSQSAKEAGRTIGAYLRELGFNLDFAPCADVLTNPENRIVRSRSFGSDPALVSRMARAFSEGLLEQGVLPCCKHFPGHGGTAEDSHLGFAVLPMDLETLKRSPELAPFLDAAGWGAPMMMAGHISVPQADGDELPASLSGTLMDLLRGDGVGYEGLIVTDALNMGAITQRYGPGEAAVRAVLAGSDLLLEPEALQEAYEAVLAAVRDGTIPEERIDRSVLRILRAKLRLP